MLLTTATWLLLPASILAGPINNAHPVEAVELSPRDDSPMKLFGRQYISSDCTTGVECVGSSACCPLSYDCCGDQCCDGYGYSCMETTSGLACCSIDEIGSGTCGQSNLSSDGDACAVYGNDYALCSNINFCCPVGSVCYIDSTGSGACESEDSTYSSSSYIYPDSTTSYDYPDSTTSYDPYTTSSYSYDYTYTRTSDYYTPTIDTSTSFSPTVTDPDSSSSDNSVTNHSSRSRGFRWTGAVIGGIAGGVAGLIILMAIGIFCCCRNRKRSRPDPDPQWQAKNDFEEDPDPIGSMDEAKLEKALIPVLDLLEEDKKRFLDAVEAAVYQRVKDSDPKDCAALKETKDGYEKRIGIVTEFIHYPQRLVTMARHKGAGQPTYKGATLDCWISKAILDEVEKQREIFFKDHADAIGSAFAHTLEQDPYLRAAFAKQFADALKKSGHPLTKKLYKAIREVIEQGLSHVFHNFDTGVYHLSHVMGTGVAHTALAAISGAVLNAVAHAVGQALMHHGAANLVQAAITHGTHTLLAKVVGGTVVTAIAHHFFGAAAGTVLHILILPVIAGVATWQVLEFPGKLAKQAAPEVRQTLANEFNKGDGQGFRVQNESILKGMAREMFKNGCKDLAKKVLLDEVTGSVLVEKAEELGKEIVKDKMDDLMEKNETYVETREVPRTP